MYCRKCGKQVNDGEELCEECRHNDLVFGEEKIDKASAGYGSANAGNNGNAGAGYASNAAYTYPGYQPAPANSRMYGFGRALTSTILGIAGVIMQSISSGFAQSALADYLDMSSLFTSLGWVFLLLSLPFAVVAVILGIKSIKAFKYIKSQGGAKPVATLVLGIIGVAAAGLAICYALINFFLLMLI